MRKIDPVRSLLESVFFAEEEIRRRKDRADELEARCQRLTPPISDMPGGDGADQGDLLAIYADARAEELKAVKHAEEQRKRVETLLDGIGSAIHREVLTLRYISRCSWSEVRKRLRSAGCYYSESHLFRLHGEALNEVEKLLKDESK